MSEFLQRHIDSLNIKDTKFMLTNLNHAIYKIKNDNTEEHKKEFIRPMLAQATYLEVRIDILKKS